MAFFGTIRKETMRWQDNRIRRIENTGSALDYYNDKIRLLVIKFLNEFDRQVGPLFRSTRTRELDDAAVLELKVKLATQLGLATILHHIDKLAWLIEQSGYLTEKRNPLRRHIRDVATLTFRKLSTHGRRDVGALYDEARCNFN